MILNKMLKYITLILVGFMCQMANAETKDQRIKVLLRAISHEFLLQVGDSTSRILPIEKIDGRYAVTFENNFSFEPDLLLYSVFKMYDQYDIPEDFIVEVEECNTKAVVHSFMVSEMMTESSGPCKMRELPEACHIFYFTEIESIVQIVENGPQQEASTQLLSEPQSEEETSSPYIYALLFILIGSGGVYYYVKSGKEDPDENTSAESTPSFIQSIGQYQFDQKAMTLIFEGETVELSAKEADLLALLLSNENKTLEREYILTQVWKNEGNYVGRTLDVFISKLRKKLEGDSNIKIVNVRGVGYRFVIH